jgi:hypothetical protein
MAVPCRCPSTTAHELAAELAGYRDEPGLQATQPIARPGPRRRPRRLLAAGAAAFALAALAALTAFAVATWPPGRKNEPQVQVPQAIQASATTASPGSPSAAASPTPTAAPRASIRPAAPPANALPAPAPAAGETVRALGGSVVVVCQDRRVQVLNVTIQPGYTIKELKAGPAPEVHIVLRSPGNESDIRVTCQGEVAVPNIKENPK